MLQLAGKLISNRLLLGTSLYPSLQIMQQAIKSSGAEIITVSLGRQDPKKRGGQEFWNYIKELNCHLLPNTAGCHSEKEAIQMAEIARELFNTNWIKLEVIGDHYNLQPDPFELVGAAKYLVNNGFEVFPFCTEDLVLCQRLVDCGCNILMPWAAPIGTGKGILNAYGLETLRARLPNTVLIVDAGIGKPSHAVEVMELGFDGVLLNTAVSLSRNPVQMAIAFQNAVVAGRLAYESGMMPERSVAHPSTPVLDSLFWHQEELLK